MKSSWFVLISCAHPSFKPLHITAFISCVVFLRKVQSYNKFASNLPDTVCWIYVVALFSLRIHGTGDRINWFLRNSCWELKLLLWTSILHNQGSPMTDCLWTCICKERFVGMQPWAFIYLHLVYDCSSTTVGLSRWGNDSMILKAKTFCYSPLDVNK
jgi:hypothetical protein